MGERVVVIGAGAVGVNASLFLRSKGFFVELIDSANNILCGAPLTCFINHGDGLEYYKRREKQTGEDCIDGSIVKSLIYPMAALTTNVCSYNNPIRFMLSEKTAQQERAALSGFYRNAEHMRTYFSNRFHTVMRSRGWETETAGRFLLRDPNSFARRLNKNDYSDIDNVAGGYAGSSVGVNMPHYYAALCALLRQMQVRLRLGATVTCIERVASKRYTVHLSGDSIDADHVLLTAGHHIPLLVSMAKGFSFRQNLVNGMYFLNSMTLIHLPPLSNGSILSEVKRINFTLQQEHGSMYACVVPPTETEPGIAATYFPSNKGNQLFEVTFSSKRDLAPPPFWDSIETLDNDHPRVKRVLEQARRFYRTLRVEGVEVCRTICRPVFNTATKASSEGKDRRVRRISRKPIITSQDGLVSAWSSPKWTNAELVGLMATDYVCRKSRTQTPLLRCSRNPAQLDAIRITEKLNFLDVRMHIEDAIEYAKLQGLPLRIVDRTLPQFRNEPAQGDAGDALG
jgi:glycine/D-amino acid oxidase-like deaminating enzyme